MTRILALIALILPSAAVAHMAASGWEYPMECCSGQDCAEIPASAVEYIGGAYRITVPASHPMLETARVFVIAEDRKQVAPDGRWHICITEDYEVAEMFTPCFFGPGVGA